MKTFISVVLAFFMCAFSLTAQVDLKLNLQKNKTYRIKTNSEQSISYSANNMQQTMNVKSIFFLSLKPVEDPADVFQSEIRFDTIRVNTTGPGINMTINSAQPGDIKSTNIGESMGSLFYRLSKCTLQVKMTNSGKVNEIVNIKTVLDSVMKDIDSIKGPNAQIVINQAKNSLNETAIKGMIEAVTAYLPGKPVKEGDKWEVKINQQSSGSTMQISTTYKLKKTNGNSSDISGDATIEPVGTTQFDIRGLGQGSFTVDNQTGWMIKGSSKQHLQTGLNSQVSVEVDGKTDIIALP